MGRKLLWLAKQGFYVLGGERVRPELPVERLDDGAVPRRLGATMSFVYLRSAGFHLNIVNGSQRDHYYYPRCTNRRFFDRSVDLCVRSICAWATSSVISWNQRGAHVDR